MSTNVQIDGSRTARRGGCGGCILFFLLGFGAVIGGGTAWALLRWAGAL